MRAYVFDSITLDQKHYLYQWEAFFNVVFQLISEIYYEKWALICDNYRLKPQHFVWNNIFWPWKILNELANTLQIQLYYYVEI